MLQPGEGDDVPGLGRVQRLVRVGLVKQRRQSRVLHCEPQMDAVRELADYLVSECCTLRSSVISEDAIEKAFLIDTLNSLKSSTNKFMSE